MENNNILDYLLNYIKKILATKKAMSRNLVSDIDIQNPYNHAAHLPDLIIRITGVVCVRVTAFFVKLRVIFSQTID